MNLNELAREVTLKEGGKKQISIAQVKEVMKILLIELAKLEFGELRKILRRYR
jgi:hypothetical protein